MSSLFLGGFRRKNGPSPVWTALFLTLAALASPTAYAQTYTSTDGQMTVPADIDFDFILATMEDWESELIADGILVTPRPWTTGDVDGNGLTEADNLAMLSAILREENTTIGTGYTGVDMLETTRVQEIKQDFIANYNRVRIDLVFTDLTCTYCGLAGFSCDLYATIRDYVPSWPGCGTTFANTFVTLLAGLETIADYPTMVNGNGGGFVNQYVDQFITAFLVSEGFGSKSGTFTGNLNLEESYYNHWGSGNDDRIAANQRPGRNYLGARYNGVNAGDVDPLIAPAHLNLDEWTSFPNREDWLVACNIDPPLHIVLQPTGGTFDSGQDWTGTASVTGGQGNRWFRWYVYEDPDQSVGHGPNVLRQEHPNVPYAYTDSDTYSIYYLTHTEDGHRYVFRASQTYWTRTSIPFDIVVNDVPLVVTISPSAAVALGASWTWTGTITGGTLKPVNAVFWFDNDPVAGDGYVAQQTVAWNAATGWDAGYDSFTVDPVDMADIGYWKFQFNDTGGTHDSTDSYLIVEGCCTNPPVFAPQPLGGAYYLGQAHTFRAVAISAFPPMTYQWEKYDAGVWTDTGWGDVTTHTLDPLAEIDAGDYRCIATDSVSSQTISNTATISFDPLVSIVTQPVDGVEYLGHDFTFTVVATGGHSPLNYQWRHGWPWMDVGTNSPTLTLTNLTFANSGSYWCVVSDTGTSTATSNVVYLGIRTPMSITTQPVGGSIIEGGQYTFQTSVKDTHGTVTYAWSKDGVAIAGQEWATLVIDPMTLDDGGEYVCTVTDDSGTLQTVPAFLDVIPLPHVPLSGMAVLTLSLLALAIVRLRRRADR